MTVFSNLTLASEGRLQRLADLGVSKINANLPSFRPEWFSNRTGQTRVSVGAVLENACYARSIGIEIQFNLVLPNLPSQQELAAFIEAELEWASNFEASWDNLSIVADDWGEDPRRVQESAVEMVANVLDTTQTCHNPLRSRQFNWLGKHLLISKCTDWGSASEREMADVYIVPPGLVLERFIRGKAYR